MPELLSRMDEANWVTPSIADILEQGAAPPGGDGSIRDYMLTIQRELADLETPAKIVNVRSMPSYTLYVARPETIGRLGSRRTITAQEIRKSLARIAEGHTDWLLGFIPKLQEDESTLGILLRTNAHRPLSLRRLLVRGNFRSAPTFHAFTLGITLEQNLIVRDLASVGHLSVIGGDNAKLHFLRSLLLTLILLNTPTELRLILAGKGCESLKALVATPHSLGRVVMQSDGLQRILEGLTKEVQRRQSSFAEYKVTHIDDYNNAVRDNTKLLLSRILVVVDSLNDPEWATNRAELVTILQQLMSVGADLGIHFVLTAQDTEQLPEFDTHFHTQIIMRTVAKSLTEQVPDFHPSLLRFIDAFIVEKSLNNTQITPVELCSTTNTELINAIAYWQQNRQQRQEENATATQTVTRTGITDLLGAPEPAPLVELPPDPYKNPLTRNTAILLDRSTTETAVAVLDTLANEKQATELMPEGPTQDVYVTETYTQEVSPVSNHDNGIMSEETQEAVPTPYIMQTQTHEKSAPITHDMNTQLQQSIALAAYLGWLSMGALMDIFGLSPHEASVIMKTLKNNHIIEDIEHPTPRFLLPSQK